MMNDIELIQQRIKTARAHAKRIFEGRANLAGILSGAPGIVGTEVTFPDPDVMHVYQTTFGRRVGEPLVFRLSFRRVLKWVYISGHPWGLKAADVVVPERTTDDATR